MSDSWLDRKVSEEQARQAAREERTRRTARRAKAKGFRSRVEVRDDAAGGGAATFRLRPPPPWRYVLSIPFFLAFLCIAFLVLLAEDLVMKAFFDQNFSIEQNGPLLAGGGLAALLMVCLFFRWRNSLRIVVSARGNIAFYRWSRRFARVFGKDEHKAIRLQIRRRESGWGHLAAEMMRPYEFGWIRNEDLGILADFLRHHGVPFEH